MHSIPCSHTETTYSPGYRLAVKYCNTNSFALEAWVLRKCFRQLRYGLVAKPFIEATVGKPGPALRSCIAGNTKQDDDEQEHPHQLPPARASAASSVMTRLP